MHHICSVQIIAMLSTIQTSYTALQHRLSPKISAETVRSLKCPVPQCTKKRAMCLICALRTCTALPCSIPPVFSKHCKILFEPVSTRQGQSKENCRRCQTFHSSTPCLKSLRWGKPKYFVYLAYTELFYQPCFIKNKTKQNKSVYKICTSLKCSLMARCVI